MIRFIKRVCITILIICTLSPIAYAANNTYPTNYDVISVIADEFDIEYQDLNTENYIRTNYYSGLIPIRPMTREDALVSLMRVYKLIPDRDIEIYEWSDSSKADDELELQYLSYARELGIACGYLDGRFGFEDPITWEHLQIFINRIKSLENYDELKVDSPIKINDEEETILFIEPLIIEFMNTLPDYIQEKLINDQWEVYIEHTNYLDIIIPNTVGLTDSNTKSIIIASQTQIHQMDFHTITVHEFAHAIYHSCNCAIVSSAVPDKYVLEIDMPKLASEYREYAGTNKHEYIACAFEYIYLYGIEKFSAEYPYTYEWLTINLK